jgi:hypothetical protein
MKPNLASPSLVNTLLLASKEMKSWGLVGAKDITNLIASQIGSLVSFSGKVVISCSSGANVICETKGVGVYCKGSLAPFYFFLI